MRGGAEFKRLFPLSYSSKGDFELNGSKKHDQRVQYLWMLYELRGDNAGMAADRLMITDPNSSLFFEVALYRQYRQLQYEISLAWGVANYKPESTAILLG
jgi:hypothetical protein